MKRKKVGFMTLGCKVNSYDSEALMEIFESDGFEIVEFSEIADVYVVNTCTVTHLGDRKSRNALRKARRLNPAAVICAVGCYVQVAPEEVEKIEEVDLLIGTKNRAQILEYIKAYQMDQQQHAFVSDIMAEKVFEPLKISESKGKTRSFIKIQEGCNRFCTYCIIPYARGPVRSRDLSDVLDEVKRVVAAGHQEVVLTGIHIASYGIENKATDLVELIEAVDQIDGLERIRLGSLEPAFLTAERIGRLKKLKHFCPHFHLSLQSGSDSVLKRMKRRYTTLEYKKTVTLIKSFFPDAALTTDVMVGFPGETNQEFEETLAFVDEIGFYQMHIFKYSKRAGTPAADYPDQVDEAVKNDRAQRLSLCQNRMEQAFLKKNHGRKLAVLFEQKQEDGVFEGHTQNYIPVRIATDQKINGKILEVTVSYEEHLNYLSGTIF
ncbi:MAG: threonylcarbamoyladenosine tRNA methylthiotransferase MtaB [Eubacteriaceae bacterium]|nr:threonylcarbamoyladenosine tRNA methylthiotransferase MtaB [Eubacteriaceae bacterium]MDK2904159.1 threonylcarbamoyladenosine tRNA methylthiotransferase MtaB [Eubacteriaceae bacterium]